MIGLEVYEVKIKSVETCFPFQENGKKFVQVFAAFNDSVLIGAISQVNNGKVLISVDSSAQEDVWRAFNSLSDSDKENLNNEATMVLCASEIVAYLWYGRQLSDNISKKILKLLSEKVETAVDRVELCRELMLSEYELAHLFREKDLSLSARFAVLAAKVLNVEYSEFLSEDLFIGNLNEPAVSKCKVVHRIAKYRNPDKDLRLAIKALRKEATPIDEIQTVCEQLWCFYAS